MTPRELLLDRCRASSRVRQLSTSAIIRLVDICCGQRLDTRVANTLATRLTPAEAAERFLAQAAVSRRHMTGKQLETYRAYVVTKEAIEDCASKAPYPEQDGEREILAKLQSGQRVISRAQDTQAEIERMGAYLEESGQAHRRFCRRADRLWKQQCSRLKAAIYDPKHYESALYDLGTVYVEVFREAIQQDGVE